jgi:hypothetical protein
MIGPVYQVRKKIAQPKHAKKRGQLETYRPIRVTGAPKMKPSAHTASRAPRRRRIHLSASHPPKSAPAMPAMIDTIPSASPILA